MDTAYALICAFCLVLIAALCWMMWLYVHQYKRNRILELDIQRLVRRLGDAYGVWGGLGSSEPGSVTLPTPDTRPVHLQELSPIPPAFRMRKPQPPPGWRPGPTGPINAKPPYVSKPESDL